MASETYYPGAGSYDQDTVSIQGYVATDGSGVPTNANDGSVTDADGDTLFIPKGVLSITKTSTGVYRLTLNEAFYKFKFADAIPVKTAAANGAFDVVQFNPKASIVGGVPAQTVDLRYKVAGTATDLVSAGFFFRLQLSLRKDR